MTEHEDNRVHYLIDACEVRGHLDIKPDDLSLILIHQRELGKEDALAEMHDLGKLYSEIRADERKKVLEDVCGVLADEIWNRPKTKDDHLHNHCIRRCIALVNQMKGEQKEETNEPLVQVAVWQVYTKEHAATGQIYTNTEDAKKCAEAIDGYVVEARLIEKEGGANGKNK